MEKKNSPTNTKDLKGKLLFSQNAADVLKNHKMVLMNRFSDTIARTITDNAGGFTFYGAKYLKEYIVKLDTGGTLLSSNTAFLSTNAGEVFGTIPKANGKYELKIAGNDINKLIQSEKSAAAKNAITINANINFKSGTTDYNQDAETEMDKIAIMMAKNKEYTLEIICHTDCKGDDAANLELSKKRAGVLKTYIVTKGILSTRIRAIGKGETEIINRCKNNVPCSETEHLENNRVEMKFYKP